MITASCSLVRTPSMSSPSSAQYIHMVQHLIEECMIWKMSKEECMDALSAHANINPLVTATVWKELEKENKEFFEAYAKRSTANTSSHKQDSSSSSSSSNVSSTQRIQNIVLDFSKKDNGD